MGWEEELLAKRREEQAKKVKVDERAKLIELHGKKLIADFWETLVKLNHDLHPEIRLVLTTSKDYEKGSPMLHRQGDNQSYCLIKSELRINYCTDHTYIMQDTDYIDCSSHTCTIWSDGIELYLRYFTMRGNTYYKLIHRLSAKDVNFLLRNVCSNIEIEKDIECNEDLYDMGYGHIKKRGDTHFRLGPPPKEKSLLQKIFGD